MLLSGLQFLKVALSVVPSLTVAQFVVFILGLAYELAVLLVRVVRALLVLLEARQLVMNAINDSLDLFEAPVFVDYITNLGMCTRQ